MKALTMYRLSLLSLTLALGACASSSNPSGGEYDEPVVPGKTKLLNLTGQSSTDGAAEVYFEAAQRGSQHDKLLLVKVDGEALANTDTSLLSIKGYQAVALKPGIHSITYCFHGKATFGSVGSCKFSINDYTFEANTRYMVRSATSVTSGGQWVGKSFLNDQKINIMTEIVKLPPQ